MAIRPFPPFPDRPDMDRAMLDRTAEALCRAFGLAPTADGLADGSWGAWSRLDALRPGHPAFVIRRTPEGCVLDTQRWDIGGGEGAGPTTRIVGVARPWWRRLAMRPAQRCLIPVTACTAPLLPGVGGGRERAAWFTMADEPVFTIAGLWRETGDSRCFAMLAGLGEASLPVVIAPADRDPWLDGPWPAASALLAPPSLARVRIGLPDAPAAFYAGTGRDRPWPPVATRPVGMAPGR